MSHCNKSLVNRSWLTAYLFLIAGVAELADAPDLGSGVPDVQVQVLSPALYKPCIYKALFFYFVFRVAYFFKMPIGSLVHFFISKIDKRNN